MSQDRPDIAKSSLARRLVAAHFSSDNGCLAIAGVPVDRLARQFGTPLYIYDGATMRAQYRRLAGALAGFARVYYSIKANPNPAVAALFVEEGAGLEIASGGEFLTARAAGCDPSRIVFAGPGKGIDEIELALDAGIGEIHIESFEELRHVASIAERLGKSVHIAVRINPLAAAQGGAMRMGGKPTAFGFDEETLDAVLAEVARHPRLDLVGVHLFAGTQILDAAVLLGQWRHGLRLGLEVAMRLGRPLRTLDLGGGLGVPYHDGDKELDLAAVQAGAADLAEFVAQQPLLRETSIIVEPGRFLISGAGVYLIGVRAAKMSRGTRFIVTDGGMNHHLAASGNLGQVIKRDYPVLAATRMDGEAEAGAVVVGPLCTPLDTLARQAALPAVAEGDLLAILQSGAYGLTASPCAFLGHPMPAEVLVENGVAQIIRPRGTFDAPSTVPAVAPAGPRLRRAPNLPSKADVH